jgi:hypothetical protein
MIPVLRESTALVSVSQRRVRPSDVDDKFAPVSDPVCERLVVLEGS